jgi:uncharacterized 2Fe-2S/4Fe-4S cluster protein (DUF4445 family)
MQTGGAHRRRQRAVKTMPKPDPTAPTPVAHRLRFPELEREISVRAQETIFQSARRNGLRIVGACGGRGSCGTCVVQVVEGEIEQLHGSVSELPDTDLDVDSGEAATPGKKWQRACQLQVRSDCTVRVAPRSLAPIMRAEVDTAGEGESLPLDPAVVAHDLKLPKATLPDAVSDDARVARALGQADLTLDLGAAQRLSSLLRDNDWSLRAYRRGNELIGFAPVESRALGLAVDLGTSNIAGFLIDLDNGRRLASLGMENPQAAWGADLISRINYAMRGAAQAQELRDAVLVGLNGLAHDLCRAVGVTQQHIVDAVICGNTAMQHVLLGLAVRQLGRAPFVAAVRPAMDLKARDLGLDICPGAWVHVGPGVGGFIGGDHVAALLATQRRWQGLRTSLVMDIGTNTEISLIHDGRIFCASCPSGPALEGGHISCGMRAAAGAIERVDIENGRIAVRTIGGTRPVGLCGSGVLDALSALRRAHMVNAGGRLLAGHPDVVEIEGKRAALLAPGVHFTQDDVRAVQLAKAAIRTGVDLLLRDQGLQEQSLERVVIAGAFGAYIDIHSGVDIGLFPDLPLARFEQVGNAAGLGVRQMLSSITARARAGEIAASCSYLELSTRTEFQKVFLHHIGFPSGTSRSSV